MFNLDLNIYEYSLGIFIKSGRLGLEIVMTF